ncbi:Os10g0366901 [Oryza sativa Japonica Group]|uniref:Uncharacterized protein n=2 Tax=Oryza sativa subsp. japonica TaxID=39947 RepID=A0A8J8YFJ5_ORYSJ|nr:hypothetical protein OsJ_31251 [Oryza sativa Japonica Group]BAT10539.1 Os10g0366901 [Oryza sativa Japonica Group]
MACLPLALLPRPEPTTLLSVDSIRLAIIPSEHGQLADPTSFFDAVDAKIGVAVEQLFDRLERRPDAIVANTYLT